MKIYFNTVEFKNILSYGNNPTKIDISNGLTAITGKNGHGKSVLLDALSYCLFGKPYRDIKMDELLNRRNRKELVVSCQFTVDNSVSYTLTRGMKPDVLVLSKDGVELDLLSSKKLNQVEIDRILGIDYDLFKQIISLSINHNKPFLAIGTPKKREIIEQIFNVSIICEMVKVVKKDQSDLKIAINMLDREVSIDAANISEMKLRLDDIERAKKNFTDSWNKELADFNEKLKRIGENYKKTVDSGRDLKKIKDSLVFTDVSSLKADEMKFREELAEIRGKMQFSQKILKNLDSYDVCPTCNNDLTGEHKTKEISTHTALISDCSDKVDEYSKKISDLLGDIKKQEDVREKITKIEYEMKYLMNQAKDLQDQKKSVEDQIATHKNKKFDVNVEELRLTYKNKYVKHAELKCQLSNKQSEFDINEKVLSVLSETGIKAYIFKKIVPVLNNIINQYLEYFCLSAEVTFDELMQETIIDLRHHSKKVSYESFSEGEKKRIDMAILLSFLKITKSLANWNCNLLVVDELLDSSVDEDGLDKLLDSLKTISKDSKNLAILLISHRLQQGLISKFDKILNIEKGTNGFSTLKVNEV